jgi:hypothetical protein
MVFESVKAWSFRAGWLALSGEGEVVQASDAEHGMVHAVPFEAAVA